MRVSMSEMGSVIDMTFADSSLRLTEWDAELAQQGAPLVVGLGGGVDANVHARDLLELVDVDFREDEKLSDPEGVVAAAVERLARDATEVARTRKRHVEQAIEEL